MVRFDAMNVTFHERDALSIIQALSEAEPFALIEPDRAQHGYLVGQVFKSGGTAIARVWWEGNPGVHVQLHREYADKLAPVLRGLGAHEVTRADACMDWVEERFFDVLSGFLMDFAKSRGLRISQVGDWVRGQSRTLYIGSRQSPYMIRLYEKGWKEGADPNWVRLEAEVKPKGFSARRQAAGMSAEELLWASKWGAAALEGFGWAPMLSKSIGGVYRPTDDERSRRALRKQYGAIMKRWYDETGDAAAFVAELLAEPS